MTQDDARDDRLHFRCSPYLVTALLLRSHAPMVAMLGVMTLASVSHLSQSMPNRDAFIVSSILVAVGTAGGAIALFDLFFGLAFSWLFPVTVSGTGLAATDFWGRKTALAWGEMASCRRASLCGFPYVVVTPRGQGRTLWLPLYLREPDAFRAAVAARVGADNPLSAALNLRRYADHG